MFPLILVFLLAHSELGLAMGSPMPECNATDQTRFPGYWGECGVKLGSVPSQVTIFFGGKRGQGFCGGSLISPRFVLTSASCAIGRWSQDRPWNEDDIGDHLTFVIAGTQNMSEINSIVRVERLPIRNTTKEVRVGRILVHPKYRYSGGFETLARYDFALLDLSERDAFPLGEFIKPICLHRGIASDDEPLMTAVERRDVVTVDWGYSPLDQRTSLRLTRLNVSQNCGIPFEAEEQFVCRTNFNFIEIAPFAFLSSGGPVIAADNDDNDDNDDYDYYDDNDSYVQIGVASAAYNVKTHERAGMFMSAYARVSYAFDFINKYTDACWIE